ncbi:MAG TPA: cytochrome b N-terminal domain-containing protein [Ktedonobacterales bacterium]|nr:cytochrome b N-terminal domain-containing protein [Ktedonobacterales bacterium]
MNLTTAIREQVRRWVPLEDLLPDTLPAFVRSPAYFFGVIALSSLALLIVTGIVLAAFGPQWYHGDAVGRFTNSLHFWGAQAFFFTLTLHLWTEFFKGSWRHGRRLTWVSGAITFVAGIGTAFTGYLSQTNFDAQWIAVQGKDAMNAVGIGAFFNLMNFGQMYGFHILVLPLIVVFLVGAHLLQVRIRGVVRPYAAAVETERTREERWGGPVDAGWSPWRAWFGRIRRRQPLTAGETPQRVLPSDQARYYRGVRMMPYDLVREGLIALLGIVVLIAVLSAVFSAPDDPPLTIQQYAQQNPIGFVTTATAELAGTGTIAQYGPPYNHGTGSVQWLGPVSLQELFGVHVPIDTAQTYVLQPLTIAARGDPVLASALSTFNRASAKQQGTWETAYTAALDKATASAGHVTVPAGNYGPLSTMMDRLLVLGSSGALDGLLVRSGGFYQNDFTRPLLFLSEDALPAKAQQLNLLGSQWGMMNETGNYPGQAWLWLYTFWYQIGPYNTSPNGDAFIWLTMAVLTAILVFFPYLPYLNRLPYYLGVHRFIWREYYQDVRMRLAPTSATQAGAGEPGTG